jgi:cysteine desulfuration protein SufE
MFEDLLELEDPTDKYEWIMDYGAGGLGVQDKDKIPENLVPGCTSRLWLVKQNDKLYCEAESVIVDGFASMICDWWNQANADQRKEFGIHSLISVGLAPLFSNGRQNGIMGLIEKMRKL